MKAPIHSIKHYVQPGPASVALAAIGVTTLVEAVSAPAALQEVQEGSIVKAIYVELWASSDDSSQSNGIASIEKVIAGSPDMTFGESQALGVYINKKNIL